MAKPMQGTKNNDNLNGTPGEDQIQAKDGNDTITGGKGNDNIDGGQGIDVAVFSGNYDDYAITFAHPGNRNGHGSDDLQVSVSDSVAGRDGIDQLSHVEWLMFGDALVDVSNGVSYFADALVDEAAQKPGTDDVINGTGIPANHYGIVRADSFGLELGLEVHYRQGPTVTATDPNGYADGELHFTVNDGPQPGNPTRAAWNFDYSIATGLNGVPTDLSDFRPDVGN
jgi:hypothetical protein